MAPYCLGADDEAKAKAKAVDRCFDRFVFEYMRAWRGAMAIVRARGAIENILTVNIL
jgi:hypothetical protein